MAATHKSRREIEVLVAEWAPRLDVPDQIHPLPEPDVSTSSARECAPGRIEPSHKVPERVLAPRPRVEPIAPARFAVHVTLGAGAHEKLRRAQALLRHAVPDGNLEQVLERALDALIVRLEKRKFAATDRPRRAGHTAPSRAANGTRHVPASVKRAVWQRDQGRCTFVGEGGHRCDARERLEFDHIEPFARGGQATAANLRLRCRAHNQLEAECTFGASFMKHKREGTRPIADRRVTNHAGPAM